MRVTARLAAAAAALLTAGLLVAGGPGAAWAQDCQKLGRPYKETPWAQKMLDFDRVRPFATGKGVTVAVLDSGVWARHKQFDGADIRTGKDFLHGKSAKTDCLGHGTATTSIIVGQGDDPDSGFQGLAPDATIIPIVVTEETAKDVEKEKKGEDDGERKSVTPEQFADALDFAVAKGAQVVSMSLSFSWDPAPVREAVRRALDAGVVLVAAAGNTNAKEEREPDGTDAKRWPAAYEGVIGVGAITEAGVRSEVSRIGAWVDIMAPGENVYYAARGGGYTANAGTSLATPYVSATAALVLQAHPELRGDVPAVVHRILGTAAPAPGGMDSMAYGHGIVDPYQAVTDVMVGDPEPAEMAPMVTRTPDPAAVAKAEAHETMTGRAMWSGVVAAVLVVLLLATVGALRRGRRRGWRPGRSKPLPVDDEPDDGAPVPLLKGLKL